MNVAQSQPSKFVPSASGMKRVGFVKGVLKPMDVMRTCFYQLSTHQGPVFVAIPVNGNGRRLVGEGG